MARKKRTRKLPNGYGSITKLSGKRSKPYWARLSSSSDLNGNTERPTLGYFATYDDAYDSLVKYHFNPYKMDLKSITFARGYDLWLYDKENPLDPDTKLSDKSFGCYKAAYNWTIEIQNVPMENITKIDISNVIKKCTKGQNTKKYIKMLISQVFDFVIDLDGPIKKNPTNGLKMAPVAQSNKHTSFLEDEIELLWNNISIPYVKEILIDIYTGQRPRELLKMHKNMFYFNENYFVNGSKTKAGIDRIIPIHPRIKPLLLELYNNTDDYLIFNRPGFSMRYEYYADRFMEVMETLELKHFPGDPRHTFVSLADYYNMNNVCKKMIVGHTQKDITDGVYTHKTIEMLYEAILVLP